MFPPRHAPRRRGLEIGFGPGIALAEVVCRAARGSVYGVDHSDVMVSQAAERSVAGIRARQGELARASADRLPHFGELFDASVAVNFLGFWSDAPDLLSELRGLLRPSGRIGLAGSPRRPDAIAGITVQADRELHDLLTRSGFTQVRLGSGLVPPGTCVLAADPSGERP
ncbi:class I SAM-dependent methyltransferase [Actinomadura yumaensis]|uniref:Class I SAM-dependent methyltransferase n=1 Tax=Actinomadura yumaensis TaxID=111807 RepID=A0ABW2CMZ3_9ACTN